MAAQDLNSLVASLGGPQGSALSLKPGLIQQYNLSPQQQQALMNSNSNINQQNQLAALIQAQQTQQGTIGAQSFLPQPLERRGAIAGQNVATNPNALQLQAQMIQAALRNNQQPSFQQQQFTLDQLMASNVQNSNMPQAQTPLPIGLPNPAQPAQQSQRPMPPINALVDYTRKKIYIVHLQQKRAGHDARLQDATLSPADRDGLRMQIQRDTHELDAVQKAVSAIEASFGGATQLSNYMRNLPPPQSAQLQTAIALFTNKIGTTPNAAQSGPLPAPLPAQQNSPQIINSSTPKIGTLSLDAPAGFNQQNQQQSRLPPLTFHQISVLVAQLPHEQNLYALISGMYTSRNMQPPPMSVSVEGMEINLARLFRAILTQGGSEVVNRSPNGWVSIATALGAAVHAQSDLVALQRIAGTLATVHASYLALFEALWIPATLKRMQSQTQQVQNPVQGQAQPGPPPAPTLPLNMHNPIQNPMQNSIQGQHQAQQNQTLQQMLGMPSLTFNQLQQMTSKPQMQPGLQAFTSPSLNPTTPLPLPNLSQPANLANQSSQQLEMIMRNLQQQQAMPLTPGSSQMPLSNPNYRPIVPGPAQTSQPPMSMPLQPQQIMTQQAQAQMQGQAQAQTSQVNPTSAQMTNFRNQMEIFAFKSLGPEFAEEEAYVKKEYEKSIHVGFPFPVVITQQVNESQKMQIANLLEQMKPIVKSVMEWLPIIAKFHKKEMAIKLIYYNFLYQDALQKIKQGAFTFDFDWWKKMKEHFERIMSATSASFSQAKKSKQTTSNSLFAASPPNSNIPLPLSHPSQDPAALSGFSSEALMNGLAMRPGLRQEDLKQPPMKKRTVSNMPTPTQIGSPAAMLSADSPAKTPMPSTPDIVEIANPANSIAPQGSTAKVIAQGSPKLPVASKNKALPKRTKSISASKPGNFVEAEKKAVALTKEQIEAQRRTKELSEAANDPFPFLDKAWTDLRAVLPTQGAFSSDNSFLSQDLLGQFAFEDKMIPPVVRDPASLSFLLPTATNSDIRVGNDPPSKKGAGRTQSDADWDWSSLLNMDAWQDEPTPDFFSSPSSNNSPPDKEEAQTPQQNKGEASSAPLRQNEFGSLDDILSRTTRKRKDRDLENILSDSFDWDSPGIPSNWLFSTSAPS